MANHDNDTESDSDEEIPVSERRKDDGRTVITEEHKEVLLEHGNEVGAALAELCIKLEKRRDDDS